MKIYAAISESIYKIKNNSLYRNAIFIMLTRFLDAAIIGFLFWKIAANYYSIEDVGIGTALLASINIITALAMLGFDNSIIRYLPLHEKSEVFNSSLWITSIASIIISIVYLGLINYISPPIQFIQNYFFLFVSFALFASMEMIIGRTYIGLRRSKYLFIQHFLLSLRVFLLVPLVFLGSLGIFIASWIPNLIAAVITIFLIYRIIKFSFKIDIDFSRKVFNFSFMNYISNLLFSLPILILPILVLNILGGESAAQYYIAYAISGMILIIPDALNLSFFVEGSHQSNQLKKSAIKNFVVTIGILIPTVIGVILFGNSLLGFFGESYAAATPLLNIFAISSFFVAAFNLFIPIQNIRFHLRSIVILNFIRFIMIVGLSYIFMIKFGIIGIGYAWVISYTVLLFVIIYSFRHFIRINEKDPVVQTP